MVRRLADGEQPYTLEAYERLTEDDGWRHEVVRGMLVREPLPAGEHGWLEVKLGHFLYAHVAAHDLGIVFGSTGYILEEDPLTLRGPDLSFIAGGRPATGYPSRKYRHGAPDLAVEIVSPSNGRGELEQKAGQFLAGGSKAVWIVDARRRTVTVITPDARTQLSVGDVLTGDPVVPGFTLPLVDLF